MTSKSYQKQWQALNHHSHSGVTTCANQVLNLELAGDPLTRRWITVHCFTGSIYETGRVALFDNYRLDKFNSWLVGTVAAALACLFWEVTLPDTNGESNGKERKQRARVLFIRVIRLYRPDYILLCGAFVFLSLAVLCEYFVVFTLYIKMIM